MQNKRLEAKRRFLEEVQHIKKNLIQFFELTPEYVNADAYLIMIHAFAKQQRKLVLHGKTLFFPLSTWRKILYGTQKGMQLLYLNTNYRIITKKYCKICAKKIVLRNAFYCSDCAKLAKRRNQRLNYLYPHSRMKPFVYSCTIFFRDWLGEHPFQSRKIRTPEEIRQHHKRKALEHYYRHRESILQKLRTPEQRKKNREQYHQRMQKKRREEVISIIETINQETKTESFSEKNDKITI